MRYLLLLCLSPLAAACPQTVNYGALCFAVSDPSTYGLSVYQDGDVCTRELLSDGVCPDYLTGGCALTGDCQLIRDEQKKAVTVFQDLEYVQTHDEFKR